MDYRSELRHILESQREGASIRHEERYSLGRHYHDKRGVLVCDQTPTKKYIWVVVDRTVGHWWEDDWDRAVKFPRTELLAQEIIDKLNAAEPKPPWWRRKRYYAVGTEEWAFNGRKRYLF